MAKRKTVESRPAGTVLYHETFAKGPGAWTTGKVSDDGHWHLNFFGQRGGPVPLGWSAESGSRDGGYAFTEPPWYFDDNHGELFWLYLAFFINRSKEIGLFGKDLRDVQIQLRLRGRDLDLKNTRLYFWLQGKPGTPREGEQFSFFNWSLTSQGIAAIPDGRWTDHTIRLVTDELLWSQMGYMQIAGPRFRILQSVSAGDGTLADILNGGHINFGFVLGGVDPNDPPKGRIEIKAVKFVTS